MQADPGNQLSETTELESDADLLALIGMDDDLVNSISNNGCSISSCATAMTDHNYGMDEVEAMFEEWCSDRDSPFDDVPRRQNGQPDIVSALVQMFNWMDTVSFLRHDEGDLEGCVFASSNGDLVLAGLFLLHLEHSRCVHSSHAKAKHHLHCPVLAHEFQKAAKTGTCSPVRNMLFRGLASEPAWSSTLNIEWPKRLETVLVPFLKRSHCTVQETPSIPFDFCRLDEPDLARSVGLALGTFFASGPGKIAFDDSIFAFDMHAERTLVLPHFAMQVATRSRQHAPSRNDLTSKFDLFCDALFVQIARRIQSETRIGEECNVFMRAARRALYDVAVNGMCCAAVVAVQDNHYALIHALKQANPAMLNALPDEIATYVFKDVFLNDVFNRFPVARVRPNPSQQMSDTLRRVYEERTPHTGQRLTVSQLVTSMDAALFPDYPEYVRTVVGFFAANNALARQKIEALPCGMPFVTPRRPLTEQNRDFYWEQCKNMELGVRHSFSYIVSSNTAVCNLRAVCKAYAEAFKDFVFRPYVEIDSYNETASQVLGSPSLRGAPALGLNYTNHDQTIHVYFARKTIQKNQTSGELKEWWQYLNPATATVGCNSIKVTVETCADSNGTVISFPAHQTGKRPVRLYRYEKPWQFWPERGNSGHHIEPQSMIQESVYSMHGGTKYKQRMQQPDHHKLVVLWDKKYPTKEKWQSVHDQNGLPGLPPAHIQSIRLKVRCPKTSAALASSSSAPIRALRYRVSFGNVRCSQVPEDPERIPDFSMQDISTFKTVVSGTSPYHYSSNISLTSDAVSKRAGKRKLRTEAERAARQATASQQ